MANRLFTPNPQFCDGTGAPYAGGSLAFYASGTSTPLATYSNSSLTIANTNPVVLDSAGRGGSIFLQNLAYKVVLSDVNNNPIWTMDPVYSSDFSTTASFLSGNGSPNGVVAGTAGSSTIPASVYWDATNNILYVCTQTGTASTAVWTAVNASSATNVIPIPQGYLTLTSGTPVIASDVTGASTVYYTPFLGNLVPIYTGTTFSTNVFSELSLSISALAASTIYDVFVFNNSGVLTLVTGPAWSSSTAGSGARGTGAGTTQIARLGGLWVNSVSMTGRNGSTTYTIPASQATYLGSLFIDTTPGQVTCHRSYGQSRKWGVWNAYNRVPIIMQAGDGTASWTYTITTIRPSNNATANSLTSFVGLPEELQYVNFTQTVTPGLGSVQNTQTVTWAIGIGANSTTAMSGMRGNGSFRLDGASTDFVNTVQSTANLTQNPTIGTNVFTCLESTSSVNNSTMNYNGTSSNMLLSASYRG